MRILLFLLASLMTLSLAGQKSYSELSSNGSPADGSTPLAPQVIPATGADFYTDSGLWSGACTFSTLTEEDMSNALVADFGIETCGTLINNASNDACFATGGFAAGVDVTTDVNNVLVVLGTGFFGAPSPALGANSFSENLVLTFTTPVNAVSFEVLDLATTNDVEVEAFGASGSLGTFTVPAPGGTEAFVGIIGSEDITSVVLTSPGGELITSLSFGSCSVEIVPTMGEWALISLGLILMIFGVVAVRQKFLAQA